MVKLLCSNYEVKRITVEIPLCEPPTCDEETPFDSSRSQKETDAVLLDDVSIVFENMDLSDVMKDESSFNSKTPRKPMSSITEVIT